MAHPSRRARVATLWQVALFFAILALPASSFGDSIDFSIGSGPSQNGTVSYGVDPSNLTISQNLHSVLDGNKTSLIGVNIGVTGAIGIGTPEHNTDPLVCIGCDLTFVTGHYDPFLSAAITINTGNETWAFSNGSPCDLGTLTGCVFLTGSLFTPTDLVNPIASGLLLGGSFIGHEATVDLNPGVLEVNGITLGAFIDQKNASLVNYYGFDPNFGEMFIHIEGLEDPLPHAPNPFLARVGDPTCTGANCLAGGGVITNTPEPSSLLLIVSGLAGISGSGLRKILGRRSGPRSS